MDPSNPNLAFDPKYSGLLSHGRLAEIDVLVPTRDAERNPLVDILLGSAHPGRVHHSYELISVGSFLVKQRSRFEGVKVPYCRQAVLVIRKVILGLRNIGKKNFITVLRSEE